jgi:putative hydrolase of the HAD superfamily
MEIEAQKMSKQLILFDLDDTLVHCNIYFEQVLNKFCHQMIENFGSALINEEQIKKKQQEIDLIGVEQLGFTLDHFPQSLVDTYTYLCELFGERPAENMIEMIRALGQSVYHLDIEPYPHMIETLNCLKKSGHTLFLYTGGVTEVQFRKINQLGLEYFFENRIHVARHKTVEEMDRLLHRIHADRSNTWMIGNSLRTDIVPALESGIHAIFIPADNEWNYNIVEVKTEPAGAYLTIDSLIQVPDAITSYLEKR